MNRGRQNITTLLLLVAILLAILLTACDHIIPDEPPPPEPPPPFDATLYFPLTVGDMWKLTDAESGRSIVFTNHSKINIDEQECTWQRIDTLNRYNEIEATRWRLYFTHIDTLFWAKHVGIAPDSATIFKIVPVRIFNPNGIGEKLETDLSTVADSLGILYWEIYDAGLTLPVGNTTWHDVIQLELDLLRFQGVFGSVRYLLTMEYYEKHIGPVRVFNKPFDSIPNDLPDSTEMYDLVDWVVNP